MSPSTPLGTGFSRGIVALTLLLSLAAGAQTETGASARAIDSVRNLFDVGNYKEALSRARDAMSTQNFTDDQRVELHKYAGLSAFNLSDQAGAKDHFLKLLQLNPDYVLDPFAVAPAAINYFEQLKRENADMLNLIRQQIRMRDDEREKRRIAEEEARRRLENMAKKVTVRTVERRNYLVNFVPFGAGQFQQGRNQMGVLLAISEGAMALTSVIGYLAINGLITTKPYTPTDTIEPSPTIFVRGIEAKDIPQADAWRLVKYGSGALFYVIYAFGVVDAIRHHEDEVVTETVAEAEAPAATPAGPAAPAPKKATPPKKVPVKPLGGGELTPTGSERGTSIHPLLFPTPGGVGAGLRLEF